MSQGPIRSPRPLTSAVAEMSGLIELLEVVWERGRDTVCAPPVSSAQARVLFLIEGNEEMNLRTLGKLLGAAPPSVTRLCDRLQAVGFLEKHTRPEDRRELRLALTPAGRTYLEQLRARREAALTEAMAAMPAASRAALATGLADFSAAVAAPLRLPPQRGVESRSA
ncbi:MarR family transcriptional regulator [Streptomyces sp. CB00455]|uniref:MarR family winged helix-turn-helix transcriptional regulator n=1 Tax=Streptomyces sp. CB00455 TaxID=1703927 RepID=UPI00093CA0F6|nr:MarR family transcriptional regulator [Streptomyces sp. CB00455]OKK17294.1 MarR family transcriptional regulator [Streptomyces sp. CB00455]